MHPVLLTVPPTQQHYNIRLHLPFISCSVGCFYRKGWGTDFDSGLSLTLSAWLALFCRGSLGHQYCSGELTYFSLFPLLLSFAHGCYGKKRKDTKTDRGRDRGLKNGGEVEQKEKENRRLVYDVRPRIKPDKNQFFGAGCISHHAITKLQEWLEF